MTYAIESTRNPENCKLGPEMNDWKLPQVRIVNGILTESRSDEAVSWNDAKRFSHA